MRDEIRATAEQQQATGARPGWTCPPLDPHRKSLARPGGFEPPTHSLEGLWFKNNINV
jgi:hypothetical protein